MPTNTENCNYPLNDDIMLDIEAESFDAMWQRELQFLPQVPHNWKEAELYKKFAESVYNSALKHYMVTVVLDKIQIIANEAYNDGLNDGRNGNEN